MSITAFIGRQGSGKTLEMTWIGIHLALKYSKRFACNYALDLDYLTYFARAIGSRNLFHMIKNGDIICSPNSIDYLLAIPDAVIAIDEIAIYLGDSIESPQKVKYLISRFNQCRRRGIELLYVAHSLDRVQKFLRAVTNNICYCDGKVTRTSNGDIHLKSEKYCYFDIENFEQWHASPKRMKFLFGEWYTKTKAFYIHSQGLNCFKRDFFKAFDSFSDITNDANSAFLLKYKKLSFPGSKLELPKELPNIPQPTITKKQASKKPTLLRLILKLIRELLKTFAPAMQMNQSDYLKNYEYIAQRKERRPWNYSSPIDNKLCKVTGKLSIFISTSANEYGKMLTADSVLRVWLYWKLPAGLELLADKIALILGQGWVLPTNSTLLRYKKPPRI